jgi:hypothetical protein
MRSVVAFIAIAIVLLLTAHPVFSQRRGGRPLPVKVTNLPAVQEVEVVNAPAVQDVNITNPITCEKPVVIAGATAALFTGKIGGLGGLWTAHEKCDAEFPGSRMCDGVAVLYVVKTFWTMTALS